MVHCTDVHFDIDRLEPAHVFCPKGCEKGFHGMEDTDRTQGSLQGGRNFFLRACFSAVDEEVQVVAEFQGVAADSWCFLSCSIVCSAVQFSAV